VNSINRDEISNQIYSFKTRIVDESVSSPCFSSESIVPSTTHKSIVTATSSDQIITATTVENVGLKIANNRIIAASPDDIIEIEKSPIYGRKRTKNRSPTSGEIDILCTAATCIFYSRTTPIQK
jgi:hypothetical protein